MAVSQGMLRIDQYRERRNPQNKLAFVKTIVARDLEDLQGELVLQPPQNRAQRRAHQKAGAINPFSPRNLKKIQMGVELRNDARFPLSVILTDAETSVDGKTPPRSKFPRDASTVPPGTTFRVLDDAIEMEGIPCQRLAGTLKMKIRYGLPGKETFDLNYDFPQVDIQMERFGLITQTNWSWS